MPAAQLSAVAFRLREDEAVGGRFQVKVTNAGDRPVHVTAVGLESPVLAAEPATPRDTVLRPGGRGDLPVRHGPAVGEPAADATDVAAMPSPQQGGRERQVRMPLGTTKASRAVLARIHDESCTAQRIAAVVAATLVVGEPVAADVGLVLPASVVLERAGAVAEAPAVTATAVGGSALYGLAAPPGALPAALAPGETRLEVPVLVRASRCSGHVLGEAKKPYELGVWLSLAGSASSGPSSGPHRTCGPRCGPTSSRPAGCPNLPRGRGPRPPAQPRASSRSRSRSTCSARVRVAPIDTRTNGSPSSADGVATLSRLPQIVATRSPGMGSGDRSHPPRGWSQSRASVVALPVARSACSWSGSSMRARRSG